MIILSILGVLLIINALVQWICIFGIIADIIKLERK